MHMHMHMHMHVHMHMHANAPASTRAYMRTLVLPDAGIVESVPGDDSRARICASDARPTCWRLRGHRLVAQSQSSLDTAQP